jgi:hypothetical protein
MRYSMRCDYQKEKPMSQMAVKLHQLDDLKRAAFQIDGEFYLFRWRHVGGRDEFVMEGYRGELLHSTTNPTDTFEDWVLSRVKVILHDE